jgi:amino-acid N-acetyltransferase
MQQESKEALASILEDIVLLHSLGSKIVIVAGGRELIDASLWGKGVAPTWVGPYRVTDTDTMQVALEVAGRTVTQISAQLSKAPSIGMVRRHARESRGGGSNGNGSSSNNSSTHKIQNHHQFAPAVQVVAGNYVTAKKRGIVNGIDFGLMGQVRFVQADAISKQLEAGNVVLLNNIGISASGDLLNCNVYDVATHAAVELKADKLLCFTGDDVRALQLPSYLPIADAEQRIAQSSSENDDNNNNNSSISRNWLSSTTTTVATTTTTTNNNNNNNNHVNELALNLDDWQQIGFPHPVLSAVVSCLNGVRRAHLIDSQLDGGLLLELYTRDGISGVCMIAADLYEGIRPAENRDVDGVLTLFEQLQEEGFSLPFVPEDVSSWMSLPSSLLSQQAQWSEEYEGERDSSGRGKSNNSRTRTMTATMPSATTTTTVLEREGRILGCCCCQHIGLSDDGKHVFEITAFIVHKGFRRAGLGDSLIDWVEQDLRRQGAGRVVISSSTGSLDWFAQRGFEVVGGNTEECALLPDGRRRGDCEKKVVQVYLKDIVELDASMDVTPGRRIGF